MVQAVTVESDTDPVHTRTENYEPQSVDVSKSQSIAVLYAACLEIFSKFPDQGFSLLSFRVLFLSADTDQKKLNVLENLLNQLYVQGKEENFSITVLVPVTTSLLRVRIDSLAHELILENQDIGDLSMESSLFGIKVHVENWRIAELVLPELFHQFTEEIVRRLNQFLDELRIEYFRDSSKRYEMLPMQIPPIGVLRVNEVQ